MGRAGIFKPPDDMWEEKKQDEAQQPWNTYVPVHSKSSNQGTIGIFWWNKLYIYILNIYCIVVTIKAY